MRPQKVFPLINSIREYRESGGDRHSAQRALELTEATTKTRRVNDIRGIS